MLNNREYVSLKITLDTEVGKVKKRKYDSAMYWEVFQNKDLKILLLSV